MQDLFWGVGRCDPAPRSVTLSILVASWCGSGQATSGRAGWAVCVLTGFTEGKRIYLNPSST